VRINCIFRFIVWRTDISYIHWCVERWSGKLPKWLITGLCALFWTESCQTEPGENQWSIKNLLKQSLGCTETLRFAFAWHHVKSLQPLRFHFLTTSFVESTNRIYHVHSDIEKTFSVCSFCLILSVLGLKWTFKLLSASAQKGKNYWTLLHSQPNKYPNLETLSTPYYPSRKKLMSVVPSLRSQMWWKWVPVCSLRSWSEVNSLCG
jgi:hypothetical protein